MAKTYKIDFVDGKRDPLFIEQDSVLRAIEDMYLNNPELIEVGHDVNLNFSEIGDVASAVIYDVEMNQVMEVTLEPSPAAVD